MIKPYRETCGEIFPDWSFILLLVFTKCLSKLNEGDVTVEVSTTESRHRPREIFGTNLNGICISSNHTYSLAKHLALPFQIKIILSIETMSNSSSTSDDQREALLETLRGYKVRTAPSQLFPGQCGVIALAPIAKGESVFPCNGELSNGIVDLTFEEVASLPSHSRKLVWAFFQPNQDPRSISREELTFPIPINGLVHAGNSFFCNSADGTGQEANVETGTKIDGSGYAELVAMRDIQVGEELLDSYPIWDFDCSGEFLNAVGDGMDAAEVLGFDISSDEAIEILDLRRHMASLKAKVARLEELKVDNEGQIAGLKRQVDSTSSDNSQLKTKMARLTEVHQKEFDHLKLTHERAMADLSRAHKKEVADLEYQAAAGSSNSRLWWECVNRTNTAGSYRDNSTSGSESENDDIIAGGIAYGATDYQVRADDAVTVDIGTLCLDDGTSNGSAGVESHGNDISPIADNRSLDNGGFKPKGKFCKRVDSFVQVPIFIGVDKISSNRQWYGLNIAQSKGTRQKLYVPMYTEAKKRDDNPILPTNNGTTNKIINESIPDPSSDEFVLKRNFRDEAYFSLMNGIIVDELRRIGTLTPQEQTDEFGSYWANSNHRGKVRKKKYVLKNSKLKYFWHYIRPTTSCLREAIREMEQEQKANAQRKLMEKRRRKKRKEKGEGRGGDGNSSSKGDGPTSSEEAGSAYEHTK